MGAVGQRGVKDDDVVGVKETGEDKDCWFRDRLLVDPEVDNGDDKVAGVIDGLRNVFDDDDDDGVDGEPRTEPELLIPPSFPFKLLCLLKQCLWRTHPDPRLRSVFD